MDYQNFDYNIKILSVGEYGVGKTSLLFCFNDDKFPIWAIILQKI